MILSIKQVNDLLSIINKNQLIVMGQELGPSFLNNDDRKLLKEYGVKMDTLYKPSGDSVFTSFHFGMLSEALAEAKVRDLTYDQLLEYIEHGDYIPLTQKELFTIDSIRAQKFNDLKTLNGKIFTDVNQILVNKSMQKQFLREEIEKGYLDKATVSEISRTIAEKTGDWSRNFDRIVAYTTQLAEQEGRAAMIQRNNEGEDPLVYKLPLPGACPHCIRLYLTDGEGSEPRLFKLSELRANGTNIGRKVSEWLATVGPIHPFCRCPLHYYVKGFVWNQKTKKYEYSQKELPPKKRNPIRVWIDGEQTYV